MKKYLELKEKIIKLIDSMEPYAQLPSISQVVEMYAVSDITVRRAYLELEKEGYVYVHHGKGTFVAPKVKEFKEVCCLYKDLEFMEHISQKHFDLSILYKLNSKLRDENIEMNLSIYNSNEEMERFLLNRMPQKNLYGVVLFYSGYIKSIPYYERVNEVISNTVFLDRYIEGINCNFVGSENYKWAKSMAFEALKKDFDRIYVIDLDYYRVSTTVERLKGYRDAVSEKGVLGKTMFFSHVNTEWEYFKKETIKTITEDIKKNKIGKVAVFAPNAYIVGFYKNISLFEDLKFCDIVCFEKPYIDLFDNTGCIWAEQNYDEIADATVDILKKNTKEKRRVLVPCEIYNM